MVSNKLRVHYGDIAPEAKENFAPTASESEFDNLAQLQQYNLNFPNYANPCELYQTVLDGTATAFPSVPENANLGLWSKQLSNDNGTFTQPIVLELESQKQYSSQGFTFKFDEYNQIYATRLKIEWFRITSEGITKLDTKEFFPDSASYFCKNFVENYNKLTITFYSINMPKNRLKLRVLDYGYGTIFLGDELRNVKIIQEIDPISSEIIINTADFTLDSKRDIEYSFQAKQPLSIYFDGYLKSTTFVKSSKRKSKSLWDIQSEDYIGLLEDIPYYGGIYNDANAYDVIRDILNVAKVPYYLHWEFNNAKITGYIPYTTCRNALMQVAFAIQAIVDTSNSTSVKVIPIPSYISQTIKLNRIMQGQNFNDAEIVTGVEVSVHSYKPITETIDVYDAAKSGTGENIFIKFSEPLHDLSITNGSFVVDEKGNELKHTNYAVINANENCLLKGQKYEHTTQIRRKNREDVGANTIEKIVAVDNATLVSYSNIDNVLEKCYNWLTRTSTTNLKIIEAKHYVSGGDYFKYGSFEYGFLKYGEKEPIKLREDEHVDVGDKIVAETEYLGNVSGIIIKQSFNLNGNIIIKEAVLK